MISRRLAVLLVVVAACGDDSTVEGCVTTTGDCPSGESCVNGACVVDQDVGGADVSFDGESSDAQGDSAADGGSEDVGPPAMLEARFPWNGFSTGSALASSADRVNPPRRPLFIVEAVEGASGYQFQLTRECSVTTFRTCPFADVVVDEVSDDTRFRPGADLPVSTERPVGSRYYWRARACSGGCSAWTEVRYLNVGRLDSDYDGDGYADLLVGSNGYDGGGAAGGENEGAVYLMRGGPLGVGGPTIYRSPTGQAESRFGFSVAKAGDVNADGYADFIVGAWQHDDPGFVDSGAAYVYLGGPSEMFPISYANPESQAGANFGHDVAGAGDLDGDGYADIVINAFRHDDVAEDRGRAYIYAGGADRPSSTPTATLTNPTAQPAHFGVAIGGVGDLDGDGYADLAVGAFRYAFVVAEVGAAFVYMGNPSRGWTSADREFVHPTGTAMGQFGESVSGGDLNGDGFSDLVVGAAPESTSRNGGAVYQYLGSRAGPSTSAIVVNVEVAAGARLGWRVEAESDINDDGFSDLLMAAPYWDLGAATDAGAVVISFGRTELVGAEQIQIAHPEPQPTAFFGYALGAGDLNGDGRPDLAIGALQQDNPELDEGTVYVWTNTGRFDSWPLNVVDSPQDRAGDRFGNALSL